MSHLPGIVVGGVVASQMTNFRRTCDNLSWSRKHHLPRVANNIPFAYFRTYIFQLGVPPILDNAKDMKDVAVETQGLLSVLSH